MAYQSGQHGLVDLFGGMEDIDRKIIRCVGDPVERFTEDALRMLRAVRFSAQLGFTVEEENTKAALAVGCQGTWNMSVQSVSRQSL